MTVAVLHYIKMCKLIYMMVFMEGPSIIISPCIVIWGYINFKMNALDTVIDSDVYVL